MSSEPIQGATKSRVTPFAFVNLRKSAGATSTHAGIQVRRRLQRFFNEQGFNEKLALGHFGTLDPLAEGVLPLAIGKATRLFPLIENRHKRYAFSLVLGTATASGDEAGEVIEQLPVPTNAIEKLQTALSAFHGVIQQVPPMTSALKHEGRRLYELARENITVDRPARSVTIESLAYVAEDAVLSAQLSTLVLRLRVHCSEGTYVRTLCEDLAKAIGTCGHMRSLLREAAGPSNLDTTRTLEEIEENPAAALLDPLEVLPFASLELTGESLQRFRHGQARLLKDATLDAAGLEDIDGASQTVFVTTRDRGAVTVIGLGVLLGKQLVPRSVFT